MSELRVDSRWWYWVAAVPLVAAFWAASALWVAAVVVVVPEASASGFGAIVSIPAVALGVPALATVVVLPLALWRDARAIQAAGGNWPEDPAQPPKRGAFAIVAILLGIVVLFEGAGLLDQHQMLGLFGILAGVLGDTWLCVRYLRARREHVEMPSSLWEWRDELREDTGRR